MYTRLPYGVSTSPGIFEYVMESLLAGIPYVIVHLDNILVSSLNEQENLKNLEEVFKYLSTAELRLKRSKCLFMAGSMIYCGQVTVESMAVVELNVQAIKRAPTP